MSSLSAQERADLAALDSNVGLSTSRHAAPVLPPDLPLPPKGRGRPRCDPGRHAQAAQRGIRQEARGAIGQGSVGPRRMIVRFSALIFSILLWLTFGTPCTSMRANSGLPESSPKTAT